MRWVRGCFHLFVSDFCLFGSHVVHPTLSLEKVDIESKCYHETHRYLSEVIEYDLIVIDKVDSEQIDARRPDEWADDIIRPEVTFAHPARSRDKWDKCTSKIMKLAEYDIPKSIFLYLSMEYRSLSTTYSEPVSVFFDELGTVPFPDPVAQIVPEHRTDTSTDDREDDVILPPESSDEYHDIHAWYSCPDDREWLDTCREKCYEIVPRSERLDERAYPLDTLLYPLRSDEWYDDESECQDSKKYREDFREHFDEFFQCGFHVYEDMENKVFCNGKYIWQVVFKLYNKNT